MDYPKLNRPPILEAVIGISIADNEYWEKYYQDVVELIKDDYTVINERVSFRIKDKGQQGNSGYDNTLEPQVIKDGFVLSNPVSKKFTLLKPDTIQVTKKTPYVDWEELFIDFKNIINALNSVAPDLVFFKPFLKYKNSFPIHFTSEAIEDYLNVVHHVPELLTNLSINNLNFSADLFDDKINYKIEQVMRPSKKEDRVVDVLINIEVFENIFKDNKKNDLFIVFEDIRQKKNEIFFSMITDKTKAFFI